LDGKKRLLFIQVFYRAILGYRVKRSEQKAAVYDQQDKKPYKPVIFSHSQFFLLRHYVFEKNHEDAGMHGARE
jgi:hypothetical protein